MTSTGSHGPRRRGLRGEGSVNIGDVRPPRWRRGEFGIARPGLGGTGRVQAPGGGGGRAGQASGVGAEGPGHRVGPGSGVDAGCLTCVSPWQGGRGVVAELAAAELPSRQGKGRSHRAGLAERPAPGLAAQGPAEG